MTTINITPESLNELVSQAIQESTECLHHGDLKRAEMILTQLIKIGRSTNHSQHLLALSLHRQGKNQSAEHILNTLIENESGNWEYWNSLGVVHSVRRKYDEAIKCFREANRLKPRTTIVQSNLALELHANGQTNEAKEILFRALSEAEEEQIPMLYFNLGNFMLDTLELKKAIEYFDKAKHPGFYAANWNRASALLMNGDFQKGWEEYESRWDQFERFAELRDRFIGETLLESKHLPHLDGKTVLVYSEQGAGDAIMFARFTKHLKDLGATVIMEWNKQFVRGNLEVLLSRMESIDRVVDPNEEEMGIDYEFDYHQSLASLPRVLKLHEWEDMQSESYIIPDKDCAPELSDHIWKPYQGKIKIGLVWAGSPSHHHDRRRSMPFQKMYGFFENLGESFQLFSLMKDNRPRVWPGYGTVDLSEGLEESAVRDLSHLMTDYNATANLISQMDLIVTVDTSIAHLAGAMGKKTYLLLPRVPDWRWGVTGVSTPWYSSLTLFRQSYNGDWETAFSPAIKGITFMTVS